MSQEGRRKRKALRGAFERLAEAVRTSPGATALSLRRAVEARAAFRGLGLAGEEVQVPPALEGYVDKVAQEAFRVTDDDVAAIVAAGWSEDAVFEVTLAAALGAALVRLERGLAALEGGEECG